MTAPNPKGLRGRWMTPSRTGLRRIIAPWEYRRPRAWARVRIVAGVVLLALALVTLAVGGTNSKTYIWAAGFVVAGAAEFGVASWLLRIARSNKGHR